MGKSQFPSQHRRRFQKLLKVGEVYALNLNAQALPAGPWVLGSNPRSGDEAERLEDRFDAFVRKAAMAGGAPPRVNLLDWWIELLARREKRFGMEGLIQRSIELCETLESNSAEIPLDTYEQRIEAGLRR